MCLQLPQTKEEWLKIANTFASRWQFPNCLGAIDDKHIAIAQPPGSGSFFCNDKKFFSMLLMGIANADYKLMFGVLKSKRALSPANIEDVVFACCVLHNFLRKHAPDKYIPQGSLDTEGKDHELQEEPPAGDTNIADMGRCASKNAADQAKETRDLFMEYFNNHNEGAVS
ncbi:hypothetical protein PoB_006186700 [Plakobranchus ocellatus]|uniref:DDE Tnp4 domain-containing protein n=1 Tax=Plakobranchus ocellatus TaxID=259542 RepID=A0AAV4CTZ0_9GAST|nr:hypothetical protein PoB_006186700 [Plakobranchus ocellatus]